MKNNNNYNYCDLRFIMNVDNNLKGLIAVRCLVDKSYTFKNGV